MTGSELPGSNPETPNHYSNEARRLALAEFDPAARLEMLQALISEDYLEYTNFAIAALQEQPDNSVEYPDVNVEKLTGARLLVDVLADKGLFEPAEVVVRLIDTLNQHDAIDSMAYLLRKGYAGHNDSYLQLNLTPLVDAARLEGKHPPQIVFVYLSGLASYGVDLFDRNTKAGRLMQDSIAAAGERPRQDYHYDSMAYSFADGGHFDKAVIAKERIRDPFYKSLACVQVAIKAQAGGYSSMADELITQASGLLDFITNCKDSCGRRGCNPVLDTKQIEIAMALVLAKQGQHGPARELAGPPEPAFAYDQTLVRTELYKASGNIRDRVLALNGLVGGIYNQPLAGALIAGIAEADRQWGNVMPSLEVDIESVPLICWELHGLYAQKDRLERSLETEGVDGQLYRTMRVLGVDPYAFSEMRGKTRDYGLATLVKLLASTGAPKTAKSLISLIETPAEKVRAMGALGRIL